MTRRKIGDKWIDVAFNEQDVDEIKFRTPVRTGDLQRGWMLEAMTGDIINPVHYAAYVEFGTIKMPGQFMIVQSLPGMTERLHERIAKQIGEGAPLFKLPEIVIHMGGK